MDKMPRKEFKKEREEFARRRKKIKKILFFGGGVGLLAAVAAGTMLYQNWREKNLPGKFVPAQSNEHVAGTGHPPYNSNPPTSGWHYAKEAAWGIYKEELADETLIHNLEHGGVWISYKPEIPEEVRKKLENFYNKYGRKIIVTPRSRNDADISLAAWTRLDKFGAEEYSDERIEKFIKAFRNRGPEFVP